MTALHISTDFDAGSIQVLSVQDPARIELAIAPDNASEFAQWFYFCLHGAAGQAVVLRFVNAGSCAYPEGWNQYRVVASVNRRDWFRIDTDYDGSVMTARTTPTAQAMYFAYFEPYSWERHQDLLAWTTHSACVQRQRLGASVEGRDMTLLHLASAPGPTPKKQIWIIARQHPGETMAEWFVEGFLHRLLDAHDAISRVLLEHCDFHVVPNMNPDGSVRGNLRTNAVGANLNREWAAPSMERSPEVYLVREAMLHHGVDLCLDVHGDEALAYNFVVGSEGNPGYSARVAALEQSFKAAWMATCPEFQDTYNYGPCAPGQANPTLATNWVAQQFGCLALTIEMPFKDNAQLPSAQEGWSGARARRLGESVMLALLGIWHTL